MLNQIKHARSGFSTGEPVHTTPVGTQVPPSGLIEPLSEREIEVLQLVADGLTNQQIAGQQRRISGIT